MQLKQQSNFHHWTWNDKIHAATFQNLSWQDLKLTERSLPLLNEAPSVTENLWQSSWLAWHLINNQMIKPYFNCYASINVKPEGGRGGGPQACVRHLTSIAFPTQRGQLQRWSMSKWLNGQFVIPVLSGTILPVWRLKAFQSGLVPPANSIQYPIDGHGALSCKAQHDRLHFC